MSFMLHSLCICGSYTYLCGLVAVIIVTGCSCVLAGREKSTLSYRVFEDTSGSKKATKTALVMHGILGEKSGQDVSRLIEVWD